MYDRLNGTMDRLPEPVDWMFVMAIGPCVLVWCGGCVAMDALRWGQGWLARVRARRAVDRTLKRWLVSLGELHKEL